MPQLFLPRGKAKLWLFDLMNKFLHHSYSKEK